MQTNVTHSRATLVSLQLRANGQAYSGWCILKANKCRSSKSASYLVHISLVTLVSLHPLMCINTVKYPKKSSQRSMSDGLSERWAYNWINSKMRGRHDVRLCGLSVREQMQEESPTDGW